MPDINVISVDPRDLNGQRNRGGYDVSPFQKKYLCQGDSWFSIGNIPPWSTTNLIQQMVLSRPTLAVNCANPGKVLAHMTDTTRQVTFINLLSGNLSWHWDALLMSGGGNDLIDAATAAPSSALDTRLLLSPNEWDGRTAPDRYISEAGWTTFANHMNAVVDQLLVSRDKRAINRGIPVFFHTYDYVTPRNAPAGPGMGPWLYKAMTSYQIPLTDWDALADALMDRLANLLLGQPARVPAGNIYVVDSRHSTTRAVAGTTGESNDFENEIHLTAHGYSLLARRWRQQLDTLT